MESDIKKMRYAKPIFQQTSFPSKVFELVIRIRIIYKISCENSFVEKIVFVYRCNFLYPIPCYGRNN